MTDEIRETAALYALGLLEEDESRAFAGRMKSDAELAALVNEYEAVAGVLSLAIEPTEVPGHLRESILNAVCGNDKVEAAVETPLPVPRTEDEVVPVVRPVFSSLVPWALAACFGILSAILFVKLRDSNDERRALAQANSIENFLTAVLEAQTEELPEVSAQVAWNEATGTGILETAGFPDQPSDKDYQLWIFDGDNPAPVSAGVFDPSTDARIVFTPERTIGKAVAFAVSIEDAGGNPQPAGPVILVGKAGAG